jgi:mono/diheme cytochrome c family protein
VNAAVVALLVLAGACRGTSEASSVSAGRVLYEENGCATCHGPAGHGDGRIAVTLNPRPRDFRDAAAFK